MNGKRTALVATVVVLLLFLVSGSRAHQVTDTARPRNFIFFGTDRQRISETDFLENEHIAGAQLKYTWRELEPERDRYELQPLLDDLAFLERHGKRLFVQLQDVSFSEDILVPDYLQTDPAFGGGVARKYEYEGDDESKAHFDGWVARRWDPAVRARFIKLLEVLGKEVDGRIEGLNLAETSIGFGESGKLHPAAFTYESYVEGIKAIMTGARKAFPRSVVIQYANFMPGEWLPWTDHGYLRAVYACAEQHRGGRRRTRPAPAPQGAAASQLPADRGTRSQDPGRRGRAGWKPRGEQPRHGGTRDGGGVVPLREGPLRLDYIFWGTQEPYYSEEILPYLDGLGP